MAKDTPKRRSVFDLKWVLAAAFLVAGLAAGFASGAYYEYRHTVPQPTPSTLPFPTKSPAVCSCPMIPAGESPSSVCDCK